MTLPDGIAPGDRVTAKRLGWDEVLTAEEEMDREAYSEKEYASDDLAGELEVVEADPVTAYLVAGQEADPKTIRPDPAV